MLNDENNQPFEYDFFIVPIRNEIIQISGFFINKAFQIKLNNIFKSVIFGVSVATIACFWPHLNNYDLGTDEKLPNGYLFSLLNLAVFSKYSLKLLNWFDNIEKEIENKVEIVKNLVILTASNGQSINEFESRILHQSISEYNSVRENYKQSSLFGIL